MVLKYLGLATFADYNIQWINSYWIWTLPSSSATTTTTAATTTLFFLKKIFGNLQCWYKWNCFLFEGRKREQSDWYLATCKSSLVWPRLLGPQSHEALVKKMAACPKTEIFVLLYCKTKSSASTSVLASGLKQTGSVRDKQKQDQQQQDENEEDQGLGQAWEGGSSCHSFGLFWAQSLHCTSAGILPTSKSEGCVHYMAKAKRPKSICSH